MKKYHIIYGMTAVLLCAVISGCDAGTSSEPAESTTVTEAVETAEPANPTEPTTPAEPAESANPTESTTPAEPAEPAKPIICTVSANWAEETQAAEYSAEGDGNAKVTFTCNGTASDFKLLSLTFVDCDDEGRITYDITELYTREELTSDSPLTVVVPFFGTIPNIGISYTDEAGELQRFTLSESGYDGSLVLSSF